MPSAFARGVGTELFMEVLCRLRASASEYGLEDEAVNSGESLGSKKAHPQAAMHTV